MKALELNNKVAAIVKSGQTDRSVIAAELLKEGATLSMVNRELPKALLALGVTEKRESMLTKVRNHLKGKVMDVPESAQDFENIVELIAENMSTEDEEIEVDANFTKAVRTVYKDEDIEVPSKPNLGKMKTMMVNYFASNKKRSLKGLAAYMSEGGIDAEKALHFARMNYTFGEAIAAAVTEEEDNDE